jgi:tRNA U38,U39,U40 pseudouridine synthase TruA
MAVGEGKIKPADVETIFAGGGRWANPAPTAPPEGLFLSGVYYPPTPEDMVEWRRWK